MLKTACNAPNFNDSIQVTQTLHEAAISQNIPLKMLSFTIQHKPIPKARHATAVRHGTAFAWDPQRDKKNWTKFLFMEQFQHYGIAPLQCPLISHAVFGIPIPASTSKKKRARMLAGEIKPITRNGDLDNLLKFYWDCMNGVVYVDDRQIWRSSEIRKFTETPYVRIIIYC